MPVRVVGARHASGGLAAPMLASAALHATAIAALVLVRPDSAPPLPPTYRVNIVAAPPGPRQVGVVTPPAAQTEAPRVAPPPPRAETPVARMPSLPTVRPPARSPSAAATPTPAPAQRAPAPAAPAQRAGGGPVGGAGADVASVRIEGIEFPYPGYLSNIVRQIALRFNPDNPNAPLRAEIMFLIHRDGSVTSLRFVRRSGVYAFDLEAQGAVEAAAAARAFGALPTGFPDDVLPVIFSFDPRLIR